MSVEGIQRLYFTPNPDAVVLTPSTTNYLPNEDGLEFANFEHMWLLFDFSLSGGITVNLSLQVKVANDWYTLVMPKENATIPGDINYVVTGIDSTFTSGALPVIVRTAAGTPAGDVLLGERLRLVWEYTVGASTTGDTIQIVGLAR